ncbi:hypothetical protein KUTeg_018220, partial [Tegillarca granosa]
MPLNTLTLTVNPSLIGAILAFKVVDILCFRFCCGAIYYGVQLNVKNLSGDRYINLLLSGLVEIPSLIFVVISGNVIGRRRTFLILITTVGASMLSVFIMSLVGKMEELPDVVTVLAMIGKAGISGGWGACMIFSGETFPTVI